VPTLTETPVVESRPSTLSVTARKLAFGPESGTFVDLSCVEPELFSQFDEVIIDVLENVRGSDHPGVVAIETVARWRRLFHSRLLRGLGAQAKIGLFAELSVLLALSDSVRPVPVDWWRGPLREPHDFELPGRCLEVKAIGADSDAIRIHGFEQLDRHDARPLDLLLVKVTEDPEGATIADVVDQLRTRVSSPADLKARLSSAGWQINSEVPDTDTYTVEELLRVAVDASTPRLVPASLRDGTIPDGIVDMTYRLDVATLLPHAAGTSLADIVGGREL
jgi:hypothetical protein